MKNLNTALPYDLNIDSISLPENKKTKNSLVFFQKKEFKVFLLLVVSVFICEIITMLALKFLPAFSTWGEVVLHSFTLPILMFPVIYVFLIKPLKVSIADRNAKEVRYTSLIENMGEGVIICDATEKFIFANVAAEKLFGVTKGTLTGSSLSNYFTKENFEFIVRQTGERLKGKSGEYESEINLTDGSVKYISINATPQFSNGIFTSTLALIRDITEIKKVEDAIKYERNLLRTLIDNIPDAVYVKNREFQKVIANPVDLKYMGLKYEEDAIGKNDYEVYSKEVADSSFKDDQYVFETGLPYIDKEDYFIDNMNQEHWMLNSKVPIKDYNGEIIGLVGIGREITEKKKEETRLKLLESVITNATDGVVITTLGDADSPGNKIIFVNEAYSKMTGYTLEEVIGKSPSILQGVDTDKNELARISECLKRFEPCKMEVINYKKNGDQFWSSIAFSPITDKTGNYTHWIAIKRDVTDRKKMEQNFIIAKEKAEAASKAKSEFLANMSHEIRTPLNSVIGFSDLMMKTKLDETQQQYNSAVFQSANALLDIINEILDFSKIEAGKLEISIDKFDIMELGSHVSNVICYQAYKKNLELLLNIGLDIPRFVWSDALRIKQILINLMSNAVKFTAEGEIELRIEIYPKEGANKTNIRFSVRDTGIGINPENQQKIFEAFSQEDASTSRKYGGTGLGLAISKRLLQLMGSELQLHSTPKLGSTFFFDLDVKTMHGEPEEMIQISNYKNMLIVDDNANNRLLLKDMLAHQRIKSDEAENGFIAINMLKEGKKYDMILMDFNMPEMDGIETIKSIRNDLKLSAAQQPIILLHSSAEDEHVNESCTTLGVAQRLVKPIKMKCLFDSISKVGCQNKHDKINDDSPLEKIETKKGNYRVLVVDDNPFNIMLITKIISDILPDATIFEATNGKEALETYTNEFLDIVFMDIQMPEMNGHEATIEIRKFEQDRRVPIIALTAGTQNEEKNTCLEVGMDDFVTKPFVSNTIWNVVNNWL
jgi:PAS domain S-box-containing protein